MKIIKVILGIASLSLLGCSSDSGYLFDFSECSSSLSYDFGESRQQICRDSCGGLDYLDIQNDCYTDFSEIDWFNYMEAEKRITYIYQPDGSMIISQKNGKEINISEKLFEHIRKANDNANLLFHSNDNTKKIRRSISSNPEHNLSGNDCVGRAISMYCNLNLDSVNQCLISHYPGYGDGQGILLSDLLSAVRLFKSNAVEKSKFCADDVFEGTRDIPGILGLYEHVVIATKFEYDRQSHNYKLYGIDPERGSEGEFYSRIWRNQIPASRDNGGMTVVYKFIQ